MRTIRTIDEMRAWLGNARAEDRTVGLVPTMGAFHAGHHSLMRAARDEQDAVVVSLFVNPAQFNDSGDLAAYPRTRGQRRGRGGGAGRRRAVRPAGRARSTPRASRRRSACSGLSEVLEGAERGPGHFAGVCTVVNKLLNIVAPDAAYFGQKDAQQVAVVKRMVRDLDMPVRIEVLPTVREPDGLALSSRNVRLSRADRARALALSRALHAARDAVAAGERDAERIRAVALDELTDVDAEYLAIVDPVTFTPLTTIAAPALVAVAAHVGPVRLIDNLVVEPVPAPVAT